MKGNPHQDGPWQYRLAGKSDAGTVRELFAEHLQTLGCHPDTELDDDMETFPQAYTTAPDSFIVVFDKRGRPVGMGGIQKGEIRRLYVRPEYRRQGIAGEIVHQLETKGTLVGDPTLLAVVDRQNEKARSFFGRLGFSDTGRAPQHPLKLGCTIWKRS